MAKTAEPAAADSDSKEEGAANLAGLKPAAPAVPKPRKTLPAVAKKDTTAPAKAAPKEGTQATAKIPRGKTAFMHYMAAVRQQIKGKHQVRRDCHADTDR